MVYTIELWVEDNGAGESFWLPWDAAGSKGEALRLANHYRCPWQVVDEFGRIVG